MKRLKDFNAHKKMVKFNSQVDVEPEQEIAQVDQMLEKPEEVLYLNKEDITRTRTAA